MSAEHDKKFFDTFMLVLGGLIGIVFMLLVLARVIAANTQVQHVKIDPAVQTLVAERITPVARVAVAGQDNSALAPVQEAPAALLEMGGKEVYDMACTACHGAGIAGAPRTGDAAAWGPRMAQGIETLNKHAIEGFQGGAGIMPAKGGRMDLSDQSVINAVEYMVERL